MPRISKAPEHLESVDHPAATEKIINMLLESASVGHPVLDPRMMIWDIDPAKYAAERDRVRRTIELECEHSAHR